MDKQNIQDKELLYSELTHSIIGCAFDEVINELGAGFLESVYENAMLIALAKRRACRTVAAARHGTLPGQAGRCDFYADLLVEHKVIVELKAVKAEVAPEHEAQIINYLNATGIEIGLLINFGNPRLKGEFKRFTRRIEHG